MIDEKLVKKLYVDSRKSAKEVSLIIGISYNKLYRFLIENGWNRSKGEARKGLKFNKKWRENMSKAKKELCKHPTPAMLKKFKEHSIKMKGNKNQTLESIKNLVEYSKSHPLKGELNPNWKGGITPLRQKHMCERWYKDLIVSVFKRDNYTCQWCKVKGEKLETHHIKTFGDYPEERYEKDNLITLCKECHNKTRRKEDTFINFFNKILWQTQQ